VVTIPMGSGRMREWAMEKAIMKGWSIMVVYRHWA